MLASNPIRQTEKDTRSAQSALKLVVFSHTSIPEANFLKEKPLFMSPFGTLERYYYEQAQENRL